MNNILSSVANIASNNASSPPQQSLAVADRADIHKSCKSLEMLLNVLNDYCEAVTAIVTLQKKLARALHDTATSKITNEIAANALNASANIFEALADVDSKFAKIADKEYDAISTEVKRWFKKLAKEEKNHDERIASANAKIKQAGLSFEKKSKKKAVDAQDEHARYIHLISTLGPEITQEKYNHSLQATQRHMTTVYSVAACLSRIADTEWVRSCESVRRFAPTVGPLGEWRSLCEGGWVQDIPGDLVPFEEKVQDNLKLNTIQERIEIEEENHIDQRLTKPLQGRQAHEHIPPPRYRRPDGESPALDMQSSHPRQNSNPIRGERELTTSTPTTSQAQASSPGNSPAIPQRPPVTSNNTTDSLPSSTNLPSTGAVVPSSGHALISPVASASSSPLAPAQGYSAQPDRTTGTTANNTLRLPSPNSHCSHSNRRDESPAGDDRERLFSDPTTGSVRSLSAFPAPPTHFPLPPPRTRDLSAPPSSRPSVSAIKEGQEEPTFATRERLSESPLPLDHGGEGPRVEDHDYILPLSEQRLPNNDDRRPARHQSNAAMDISQGEHWVPILTDGAHTYSIVPGSVDSTGAKSSEQEMFRAKDFGVLHNDSGRGAAARARSFSNGVSAPMEAHFEFPSVSVPSQRRGVMMERTDTGTSATGSIVAAMKNRYTNASGSRSPPPPVGDLPRLNTSVTEMANRYQPAPQKSSYTRQPDTHIPNTNITDGEEMREQKSAGSKQPPSRPLTKSSSPAMSRHIPLPTTPEKIESRHHVSSSPLTPTPSPRLLPNPELRDSIDGSEDRAQWRRVEARERELREREQEISLREYELELDRAKLLALRDGLVSSPSANSSESSGHNTGDTRDVARSSHSSGQLQPRKRRISFRRSRQDSQPQTSQDQLQPPSKPALQGNLISPASNPNLRERHQSIHSYSSPQPSFPTHNQDHTSLSTTASFTEEPMSHLSRSTGSPFPQIQQQEKKGGWMRRLSMPVGNALPFSLDSSKRQANNFNSSSSSTSANVASPKASTRQLGAGIVGGKGVTDERRTSTGLVLGLGSRDTRAREYVYGQALQQQSQEQDSGYPGLGLGRKSHEAARSASNLNLGLGRNK